MPIFRSRPNARGESMKTIRRTSIKVKRRELIIVKNEAPAVCPVCHSPLRPNVPSDDEHTASSTADDRRELPAAEDSPEKP